MYCSSKNQNNIFKFSECLSFYSEFRHKTF